MSGLDEEEPPLKKQRSENNEGFIPVAMVTQQMTLPGGQSIEFGDSGNLGKPKGSARPIIVTTSGNIRPSLLYTPGITQKVQHQMTLPSNWSSDGKRTFNLPPGVTFASPGSPRFPTPQVITLPTRTQAPATAGSKQMIVKCADSKVGQPLQRVVTQADYQLPTKPGEPIKLPAVQTQISFQVPATWNTQASGKSLLDTSKVSLVSYSSSDPNSRSLLQGNTTDGLVTQYSSPDLTSPKVVATPIATTPAVQKTYITGNKVIGNLTSGQVITHSPTGIISVSRSTSGAISQPIAQRAMNKGGSFLISNKQYTIVPNSTNQVVTQLVKTDTKINKGKVTMAEAQIMLPSGPAKISWPIQTQASALESNSKQILITTPVIKSTPGMPGKTITQKASVSSQNSDFKVTSSTSSGSLVPTAKVVEVAPAKVTHKSSILPAQKNWELVKQASQLLPQKCVNNQTLSTTTREKTKFDSTEAVVVTKELEKIPAIPETTFENDKLEKNDEPTTKSPENTTSSESKPTTKDTKTSNKTPDNSNEVIDKIDSPATKPNLKALDSDGTEKMEIDDVDGGRGDDDSSPDVTTDSNSSETKKEDFNPVDAMKWKNGVGELPGSNLKMNDFDMLEVISDELECTETLNTSDELDKMGNTNSKHVANSNQVVSEVKSEPGSEEGDIKQEASVKKEVSNKDEIAQCENCANYGFVEDFYKDGRFCSQSCVNAFNCRHMRDAKKQGTMSKVILGMKKGRKKLLLKDGSPKEQDLKQPDQHAYAAAKKNKSFVWTRYLEQEHAVEAPARLFKNPFPAVKNYFRVGMKLEGTDPNHQSKFCVLSVSEVCGYRIRLHFDGYSECYDFWSDIDSSYIFPVGFCEKNNKALQPPKGFSVEEFSWTTYLKLTKASPVPKSIFSNQPVQSVTPNPFRVSYKMEAIDKKNSSLICVASVADTMGDKVLVHFDSWEDNYDYWCDMTSPLIHPIGFCEDNDLVLSPPQDWHEVSGFTWEKFLSKSKSQAVPPRAFKPRPEILFDAGMKVEVVDKRNPLLVRVASIVETENYMVKIHFDGWADMYDYWLEDDSPDIHPPGWCAKTGHPLVPPITPADLVVNSGPGVCPTPGCKGIGHIKGPKYSGHHSTFGCPYSEINMNKESVLGDRLGMLGKEEVLTSVRHTEHAGSPDSKRTSGEGLSKMKHGANDIPKKFGRGRKPKSYYQALEDEKAAREKEESEETLRLGIHNSVFSSSMISTPKTEVPLCWEQHCKLLPGVTNIRGNDVNKWTIDQVADFVNTLPGCEEQAKLFKEEQIDGEAFLLMTQPDLVKIMNIKLGPALKIFNSIVMFKNSIEV